MKMFKGMVVKFTSLALVFTLLLSLNAFAGAYTGQIRLGSGNTGGYVTCGNGVSGNTSSGYYAQATTLFQPLGNANYGVTALVRLKLVNSSVRIQKKYTHSTFIRLSENVGRC